MSPRSVNSGGICDQAQMRGERPRRRGARCAVSRYVGTSTPRLPDKRQRAAPRTRGGSDRAAYVERNRDGSELGTFFEAAHHIGDQV